MTQEKNLTKEILSKRQDEREVTSRVLKVCQNPPI